MSPKQNDPTKATKAPVTVPTDLTLEQAAAIVHLTPFRVRMAIHDKDLKAVLVPMIRNGVATKQNRLSIQPEDLKAWRDVTGTKSKRTDGRTKFNLYANPSEYEAILKLFKEQKIMTPIQRANIKKAVATALATVEAK